jgi:hypothetical protein
MSLAENPQSYAEEAVRKIELNHNFFRIVREVCYFPP